MPKHDQFLWKQKTGALIKVIDMQDSHVVNAVAYFRRKAEKASAQMPETFNFRRVMGGTIDEFLCDAMPAFRFILLEGKVRGIVETNMTYTELIKLCEDVTSSKLTMGKIPKIA